MKDDELEVMFDRIRGWDIERKEQALGLLAVLEKSAQGVYPLSEEEVAELEKAMLETDEANDEEVAAAFGRSFR